MLQLLYSVRSETICLRNMENIMSMEFKELIVYTSVLSVVICSKQYLWIAWGQFLQNIHSVQSKK